MQQQLARGPPQDACAPMDSEQQSRVPGLQGSGQKQHPPRDRHTHEQQHAELDDAAGIEAVGERAAVDREQQKRQPVGNDRETGKGRRVEFPEDYPVADDVLDIVRQHRQRGGGEIHPEAGMTESCERGTDDRLRLALICCGGQGNSCMARPLESVKDEAARRFGRQVNMGERSPPWSITVTGISSQGAS